MHALASHDLLLLLYSGHAIGIHLSAVAAVLDHVLHLEAGKSLLLTDGTILVGEEKSLQVDDLIPKLVDLGVESIILTGEYLDLVLQVGKPLLLALSALQCGDPDVMLGFKLSSDGESGLPISLEKVLSLLLISHLLAIGIVLVFAHILLFVFRRWFY